MKHSSSEANEDSSLQDRYRVTAPVLATALLAIGLWTGIAVYFGITSRSTNQAVSTLFAMGGLSLYAIATWLLVARIYRQRQYPKLTINLKMRSAWLLLITPVVVVAFTLAGWVHVSAEIEGNKYESIIQAWPHLDDPLRSDIAHALQDGQLSRWEWMELAPNIVNTAGMLKVGLADTNQAEQRDLLKAIANVDQ